MSLFDWDEVDRRGPADPPGTIWSGPFPAQEGREQGRPGEAYSTGISGERPACRRRSAHACASSKATVPGECRVRPALWDTSQDSSTIRCRKLSSPPLAGHKTDLGAVSLSMHSDASAASRPKRQSIAGTN